MDVRRNVLEAIGNTPIVKLNRVTKGLGSDVYIKLEYYNPTGSYKDRMALAMIEGAERDGLLKPGDTVVEYTGGSTGSSLALVCAVKGYALQIVTSDAFSEEKINTMKALGAAITMVSSHGGKITPDLVPRMMSKAEELGKKPNTYRTNQYYNKHALRGYNRLADEVLQQLDGRVDGFVASVGTAGCAMGVAEVLKARNPDTKVFVAEPSESPIISRGLGGTHHIEGIGSGILPPLLRKELYDEVLTVREEEAKDMARRLSLEEGVFAGTSTGANVVAAIAAAKRLDRGKNVVTVAVDSGLKYLSTELYR
ncbi:MAG: cysteine synthase family protein [Thaumarchaeota archaeon]|nr:cysteine synthase family protein [Nitrososphaerota archaeon]MCS4540507.1 cysteine synthase family protein [Nitrososphaerota archaeon]